MDTITMKEFQTTIKNKNNVKIIDVRELDEYLEGHIEGAKLIPMYEIPERLDELDLSQHYYLVCRSGRRSADVGVYLSRRGYKVTNIDGGMLEWDGVVSYDG